LKNSNKIFDDKEKLKIGIMLVTCLRSLATYQALGKYILDYN